MPAVPTEILFLHHNHVCGCYLCFLTDCTLFIKLLLSCCEPPWQHMHLTDCKIQCQLLLNLTVHHVHLLSIIFIISPHFTVLEQN